jgi:four helix bundle protein
MIESANSKKYDLEERTYRFEIQLRDFIRKLPETYINLVDSRQLIRSFGSVGANYIEANASLGKKDFLMGIRICRKEAKESAYWLRILSESNGDALKDKAIFLFQESIELTKIFHAILEKSKQFPVLLAPD